MCFSYSSKYIHIIYLFFQRQGLALLPRLECRSSVLPHGSLGLQGISNLPTAASQVVGTTGTHHHAQITFVFLVEMEFHHVGQAGLELLTPGDPPASASQSAGITGLRHCPNLYFYFTSNFKVFNYLIFNY